MDLEEARKDRRIEIKALGNVRGEKKLESDIYMNIGI